MSANFNIKREASRFREINGLNPSDPIRLHSFLMKLGVLTLFRPISVSFSGMAVKADDHRFMLINSQHPVGRQNFTICHELYHLYVQKDFTSMVCKTGMFDKKDRVEYEADLFASYFLMPEEGILSMIPEGELKKNKIKLGTIVKIEQYFQCSRAALLFRLHSIGLIELEEYKGYESNVRDSAKFFGYDESLYTPAYDGLTVGEYGQLARNLFIEEKISESHYAELMSDIGIDFDVVETTNPNKGS